MGNPQTNERTECALAKSNSEKIHQANHANVRACSVLRYLTSFSQVFLLFHWMEKQSSRGGALEYLVSSGTKL